MNSKLRIFLILCLLIYVNSECKKEEQHPIPDVYVNFLINIQTDPEYFFLLTQGNSIVINSSEIGALSLGYNNNGIIIYNSGDGEFYAFDRTCPHDIPESIVVETDGISGFATCPQCGSVYVFPSMGLPTVDSPSRWPLKKYNAFYNPNTGDLLVTN
jgi:nitrite reductase/ring-hydroxylating ferredoxin subunit